MNGKHFGLTFLPGRRMDNTKIKDDIAALSTISDALEKLPKASQAWVLKAIIERLALTAELGLTSHEIPHGPPASRRGEDAAGKDISNATATSTERRESTQDAATDSLAGGLSSVAKTWLKR